MDRVCIQLTCLKRDHGISSTHSQALKHLLATKPLTNGQIMTKGEIRTVLFVAVSMLAGGLVLLVKQFDAGFMPDLAPAAADRLPAVADKGGPVSGGPAMSASSDDIPRMSDDNLLVSDGKLRVPINTAPASELQKLPGIGPTLAERIIAFRKQSGAFVTVEQLLEVKGIGPAKLGRLRPFVELR